MTSVDTETTARPNVLSGRIPQIILEMHCKYFWRPNRGRRRLSTWFYDVVGSKSIINLLFAHSYAVRYKTLNALFLGYLSQLDIFPHTSRHSRQVSLRRWDLSGRSSVLRNRFDSCRSGKSIRKQINKASLTGAVSLITWCVWRSSLVRHWSLFISQRPSIDLWSDQTVFTSSDGS